VSLKEIYAKLHPKLIRTMPWKAFSTLKTTFDPDSLVAKRRSFWWKSFSKEQEFSSIGYGQTIE